MNYHKFVKNFISHMLILQWIISRQSQEYQYARKSLPRSCNGTFSNVLLQSQCGFAWLLLSSEN